MIKTLKNKKLGILLFLLVSVYSAIYLTTISMVASGLKAEHISVGSTSYSLLGKTFNDVRFKSNGMDTISIGKLEVIPYSSTLTMSEINVLGIGEINGELSIDLASLTQGEGNNKTLSFVFSHDAFSVNVSAKFSPTSNSGFIIDRLGAINPSDSSSINTAVLSIPALQDGFKIEKLDIDIIGVSIPSFARDLSSRYETILVSNGVPVEALETMSLYATKQGETESQFIVRLAKNLDTYISDASRSGGDPLIISFAGFLKDSCQNPAQTLSFDMGMRATAPDFKQLFTLISVLGPTKATQSFYNTYIKSNNQEIN